MNSAVHEPEETKQSSLWRIARRLALYFGLAFAGLAFVTITLALSIHFGITGYLTGAWIGFIGYTGLLFWVVVRQSRSHWDRWVFWVAVFWFLTIHCFIFIAILRAYPQWRMLWFWPIVVVEGGLIGTGLEWLFPERHRRAREL